MDFVWQNGIYRKVKTVKSDARGLAEMVAQEWTNFLGQTSVLPINLVPRSSISSFCGLSCFHHESCGDVTARKVKHARKHSIVQTQDLSNQIKERAPSWP